MENLFTAEQLGGYTEKELSDTPPLSFTANGDDLLAWTIYGNMVQTGTPTPESQINPSECGNLTNGDYIVPITCGGVTTNINLSEVQSTRYIKKLVLTGEEEIDTITVSSVDLFRVPIDYTRNKIQAAANLSLLCNTYSIAENRTVCSKNNNTISTYNATTDSRLIINDERYTTATDYQQYLATQYANGEPVIVWYVLATPITGTVNEPLRKISTYTDGVSDVATIPTVSGSNTLSVGTTIQPSSVYIKYKEGGDEMVTLAKIGGRYNTALLEIRGLSTDTKPTTKIEGVIVTNGSTYIEIDTGDTYMFDAENGVWHNITG